MSKRNFPLGFTNYYGSSSSPNYNISLTQVNSSTQQQNSRKLQRIFKNHFIDIEHRLRDYLLAYLISKDIYADSEDIEEELEIRNIGQIYNVFQNNFKNKSDEYKNFFRRGNGQVIQVKTLLNRELLPLVESLKNENNDVLFDLFSNVLGDFNASYGSLPDYKQDIVAIGRFVLIEIEKNLKKILSKQQQKQRQALVLKQQERT